jgi:hypothetical protein
MMPWIRLDDQFPDHPKVLAAGPAASWLYVCGIGYCNRLLTDGLIPSGQVRKLADVDNATELAGKLVEAGLWEQVEGGYQVHDFLDYQPSAEQVKAERADNAKRQQDWRDRKKEQRNAVTNTVTDTVSNAPRNGTVTPAPYPPRTPSRSLPDPDPEERVTPPIPPTPLRPARPAAAPPDRPEKAIPVGFSAFWEVWPKREGKSDALAAWRKLRPDDDTIQSILDAIPRQQAAKDWPRENWRYCPLPASWLNQRRWEDEIPDPPPKGERELIGKDKERAEVMRRALEKRGYEFTGPQPTAHPNGREVSHQPLRVGDGRVPR